MYSRCIWNAIKCLTLQHAHNYIQSTVNTEYTSHLYLTWDRTRMNIGRSFSWKLNNIWLLKAFGSYTMYLRSAASVFIVIDLTVDLARQNEWNSNFTEIRIHPCYQMKRKFVFNPCYQMKHVSVCFRRMGDGVDDFRSVIGASRTQQEPSRDLTEYTRYLVSFLQWGGHRLMTSCDRNTFIERNPKCAPPRNGCSFYWPKYIHSNI